LSEPERQRRANERLKQTLQGPSLALRLGLRFFIGMTLMSQATVPAEFPASNTGVPCPRCKKPLIDPKGLGWCKACGYCKSLAESEAAAPVVEEKRAPELGGLTATGVAIGQAPLWMWVTLIGLGAVIGGTWAAGKYLTLTPFNRALFTTLQMCGGLALMFLGQFMGMMRMAPDDPTMGFKDAIFPFKLYGMALKYMPSTQWTIYFGVWGLAAIISVNIFVGGMLHWLEHLPSDRNKGPKVQRFNNNR